MSPAVERLIRSALDYCRADGILAAAQAEFAELCRHHDPMTASAAFRHSKPISTLRRYPGRIGAATVGDIPKKRLMAAPPGGSAEQPASVCVERTDKSSLPAYIRGSNRSASQKGRDQAAIHSF
jgi:hypothetical protein